MSLSRLDCAEHMHRAFHKSRSDLFNAIDDSEQSLKHSVASIVCIWLLAVST